MRSYAQAQRGGALVMTLVILMVFLIMAVATTTLINRQFHEVVGQEQEEQAFQIAEAGVDYALWLLDQRLVDLAGPQPIMGYQVTDHTKDPVEVLGTFDVAFEVLSYAAPLGPATVRVESKGEDAVLKGRKQTIEAVLQSEAAADEPEDKLEIWRVIEWDHKPYLD